jgi:Chemotaxis phosphatase CheX
VSLVDEFEEAREDLEALLVECLATVLHEEAGIAWGVELPPGPTFSARLAIHDAEDHTYTEVVVSTSATVARLFAARMMAVAEPSTDDMLDAICELGNITGGNVKSLLRHACRLSLPTAEVTEMPVPRGAGPGVTVQAMVLGQLVELTVGGDAEIDGLCWPGSMTEEILETRQ